VTSAVLTISAVAEQTDLSIAVLRAWELRYGFPTPDRLPSGHRRYSSQHVEQVRQVQRHRAAGASLQDAISTTLVDRGRRESSIFAGVRRRWPNLPVHRLSKRAVWAVSRSIEDECCARADRPVLIGSFQRERFYRQSEHRWRELARTASAAMVFADFESTRHRPGAPSEIAAPRDAPLLREWVVICDGSDAAACLIAVELANADDSERHRRFDTMWTVEPGIVRDASNIACVLAGGGEAAARQHRPPPTS